MIHVSSRYDDEIRDFYVDCGFDMTETGRRLHLSRNSVRRRLLVMGIPLRSRARHQPHAIPHEEYERTIFMYCELKMSTSEVGLALGIRPETVRDRLRRAGVPRRSASEANRISHSRR